MYPEPIEDDRQTTLREFSIFCLKNSPKRCQRHRGLEFWVLLTKKTQLPRQHCSLNICRCFGWIDKYSNRQFNQYIYKYWEGSAVYNCLNKVTLSFVQTITNCVLRKTVVTNLLTCYQPGVNALLNTNISNISININNNWVSIFYIGSVSQWWGKK